MTLESQKRLGDSDSNETDGEILVRSDYSSEQELEYAHLVLLRKQVDHEQKIL